MLPSFRLIAATFLCGFFVVFAGLRMAASLNDIHEGLPVMAAHAAPVSIAPVADRETRRGQSAMPVMFDLRFAVSTANLAPTPAELHGTRVRSPGAAAARSLPSEDIANETAVPGATAAEARPAARRRRSPPSGRMRRSNSDARRDGAGRRQADRAPPLRPIRARVPSELPIHPARTPTAAEAPAAATTVAEPATGSTSRCAPGRKTQRREVRAVAETQSRAKKRRSHARAAAEPAKPAGTSSSPFGALPGNPHP